MPEGQSFPERLRALRRRGSAAVSPLWIEQLPPEEALAELRARAGDIFRLQEARVLLDLGRRSEAAAVLKELGTMPMGLAAVQRELSVRAGGSGSGVVGAARETLPGGPAVAGAAGEVAPEGALAEWLGFVRDWRRALRV